ncbi:hypothetical protein [Methylophilus sp. Leaf408]|uniref:hypothetical protein n=1 Tax=Methylophilus sp. Leaf408 TaxID=2876561 RepID=UPI001E40390B|nr:hypothetical protein [Methylophilus sp. Leaf408]
MGLQQFDPTTYRFEYIPQRIASLETCIIACHTVLSSHVDMPLDLNFGNTKLSLPDSNLIIGLAIDAGLIANRTLLNFMGLKLSNGSVINESYALTIERFSIPLTPVVDAFKILEPMIPSTEMHKIWAETLKVASKSAAHFTEDGATIQVARLGFACLATAKLVRHRFFNVTGTPEPHCIIPSDIEPKIGSIWDAVDPTVNLFC